MREYVDLSVLTNWVTMLRSDVDGAIWLADDEEEGRFYDRCAHRTARVVPAPDIALRLLETVEGLGVQGVVAVVRGPHRPENVRENVFRPSLGDLASLLVVSRSCDRVIEEICGTTWLRAAEKDVGPVRSRVVMIACLLEQLRRACLQENLRPLEMDTVGELFRWDRFELDWDCVHSILVGGGLSTAALERIRAKKYGDDLKANILECDGMDAVRVMAVATQCFRPRGIKAQKEVSASELIGMLRVAFDLEELEDDGMFWRMRQWERRGRYPLLQQWRTLDPLGVVLDQRYWEGDLARMLRACLEITVPY